MVTGRASSSFLFIVSLVLSLGIGAGSAAAQSDDKPVVVIDTSMGPITVALDAKTAPKTTENFLKYVDEKFFDGLTFHRVIPGFMIQGGGFDEQLKEREEGVSVRPSRNEHGQRLDQRPGHDRHGANARSRLGDEPVLHQSQG